MFVDDEPQVLKLFKSLVEPLGFEVLTLADSQEAAQRIRKEKFDAVLVDAVMPHPDGFELTALIRGSPSNFAAPIVMLTGYDNAETMRKGFRAGVTCFLGKPLTQSRIMGMMRSLRGAMLREKMRYTRVPFKTVVICRLDSGRPFKSESVNISAGGILLEKSGGGTVGQELDLEFMMPQASHPVKPRGKIVHKEGPDRMGLKFITLETEELELIQRFVSEKMK